MSTPSSRLKNQETSVMLPFDFQWTTRHYIPKDCTANGFLGALEAAVSRVHR
jgi:hypothetical protein